MEERVYNKVQRFEDLVVWQEAMSLAKDIFLFYKENKKIYLRDQMNRSALSISSNIAEGLKGKQIKSLYSTFI